MSLAGDWKVFQAWNGKPPYWFRATFNPNGTITVKGGFFGTWTVLGNEVSLAIANFKTQTITSYCGNLAGSVMGGAMTGAAQGGGGVSQGVWSAHEIASFEAPEEAPSLPD